jgi:glycosyltransferase involved in cell wall biosynthesis
MNKITILGTAYPYRGGLASFNEMLARTFLKKGKQVNVKTFTVQYPSFLFPGKTQYSESAPPEEIDIERCVNSVNPLNWIKIGLHLKKERPDMVLVKYWTPFLAPCLGTICYLAKRNRHTKILSQLDNVVPHEGHFFDVWLTRYFIRAVDGFIYMSQQVKADLDKFTTSKPALFSPHPVFANFGERIARKEALAHLTLSDDVQYLLFFGIIRDYKGLDLLIDAWKQLKDKGLVIGKKVIVAGEYYNNKEKYTAQITALGLQDDILVHDYFIRDDEVKYYFSVADVVVQPYKDATQSGVTQIAYQFSVPMIVTNVGGLAEIVPDGKSGFVADATPESIATAIEKFYACGGSEHFVETIREECKRFTWEAMTEQFERLYEQVNCRFQIVHHK